MDEATMSAFCGKMTREKETALSWLDAKQGAYEEIAKTIWAHPELGLAEFKSSEVLIKFLEESGFVLHRGISKMPTAFVATWGSGRPVIGFMAEYDALPNLSQKAQSTSHEPIVAGAPGHGCGHNLLGTSSCAAAIATKAAMEKHGVKGTLKVFGTPAEETLTGKVFMARDGIFDHTEVMIAWHPEATNGADYKSFLALSSIKFRFTGKSSHGGSAPEAGRSALDAVELMSAGTHFMRSHIIQEARIMHVITKGGEVPNNVPPGAEIWYFVRAPRRFQVDEISNWMLDVAKGAALMTQTKMNFQILSSTWEVLPNKALARVGDLNASLIGPPTFSRDDQHFGERILSAMGIEAKGSAFDTAITHPDLSKRFPHVDVFKASTDLGNVTWICPTLSFSLAATAKGTPHHSWEMVSQTNSPPAIKAGLRASEWMAASALDCLLHPEVISEAWKEHKEYLAETRFYHPVPSDLDIPSFKDLYGVDPELVPGSPERDR
jgi:aminobenzoyl-glutamate utilization protein B